MNKRIVILLLTVFCFFNLYAHDDSAVAQEYVKWVRQAIDEERWSDALTALERASDFALVSSDISYLLAFVQSRFPITISRIIIVDNLNKAIDTNRWVFYNENQALLLRAEHLIVMRDYNGALDSLYEIGASGETAGGRQVNADTYVLYLLALRGLAADPLNAHELAYFRSGVLSSMDRFPRDPRPLSIFFQYARGRMPQMFDLPDIVAEPDLFRVFQEFPPDGDVNLLELALRRLPFLLEADPELAWMAAPLMRDLEAARRLLASYRSGSLSKTQDEIFIPNPASIPPALNLGLIDDNTAIEELFAEAAEGKEQVINKDIALDVYNLLRSEEGRELFTRKLLAFSGFITCDDNRDGYINNMAYYRSGVLRDFAVDTNQTNIFDLWISFGTEGAPYSAKYPVLGHSTTAQVQWERYPSVKQVTLDGEIFQFAPAGFLYAPVAFIELGGSNKLKGISFPVMSRQAMSLTRHVLISSCSSLTRPSLEIDDAIETIYLNNGVLVQVIETYKGQQVSITEFDRGLPVIQYIDLDLDGRMETIRRFRYPPQNYVWRDLLDYRRLIASSESDWSGDGRHKTREVYLPDGSVVYSFDMDGSGEMNYETGTQR